jgi:hypothetical protein
VHVARVSLLNFILSLVCRCGRIVQCHCSGIRVRGIQLHILVAALPFETFVLQLEGFELSRAEGSLDLLGRHLFREGICVRGVLAWGFVIEFAPILRVHLLNILVFDMNRQILEGSWWREPPCAVETWCLWVGRLELLCLWLLSTNKIKSSIFVLLMHHIILIKK